MVVTGLPVSMLLLSCSRRESFENKNTAKHPHTKKGDRAILGSVVNRSCRRWNENELEQKEKELAEMEGGGPMAFRGGQDSIGRHVSDDQGRLHFDAAAGRESSGPIQQRFPVMGKPQPPHHGLLEVHHRLDVLVQPGRSG